MNDIDILKDYQFYIAKSVDEATSFITEQLDNAIRKAFLSTGYTEQWLMENRDRINVDIFPDQIDGSSNMVFKVDKRTIFSLRYERIGMSHINPRLLLNFEISFPNI